MIDDFDKMMSRENGAGDTGYMSERDRYRVKNAMDDRAGFFDWCDEVHDIGAAFNSDNTGQAEYGYHFRLPGGTKAFVGRASWEHEMLMVSARGDDLILRPHGMDNPVMLCRDVSWNNDILLAAGILVSFTLNGVGDVEIAPVSDLANTHILKDIQPVDSALLEAWKIESHINPDEVLTETGNI